VGALRDQAGISPFVAFAFALLFTIGALLAFLIEMLLASRGIRDLAASASEPEDAADSPHDEGGQGAVEPSEARGFDAIKSYRLMSCPRSREG
jgi:hypothetical protein